MLQPAVECDGSSVRNGSYLCKFIPAAIIIIGDASPGSIKRKCGGTVKRTDHGCALDLDDKDKITCSKISGEASVRIERTCGNSYCSITRKGICSERGVLIYHCISGCYRFSSMHTALGKNLCRKK